jgi:hypothetical protein
MRGAGKDITFITLPKEAPEEAERLLLFSGSSSW